MDTVASRKREHAVLDASDYTSIAPQDLSVKGRGGVAELGMLDQEAFARVIASGQQSAIPPTEPIPIEPAAKDVGEEPDEEEGAEQQHGRNERARRERSIGSEPAGTEDGAECGRGAGVAGGDAKEQA